VALKVLGLKFMIKTIYGVVVLTFLLTICQSMITEPIVKNEPLLSGVIGGMMCGVGIGWYSVRMVVREDRYRCSTYQ
jgi:hypothetical protein